MNAIKIVIPAETVWNACRPKYNGYAGGYGPHGKTKYCRKVKHKNKVFE